MIKLTLLLSMFANPALAEQNVSLRDSHYVTIGFSDAKSEVTAREESCNRAKKELIAFLFGTHVKVDDNMIKTLDKIELSQKVSVNSDFVRLKGVRTNLEKTADSIKCTIHYPEKEAKSEKARLAKVKATLSSKKLNRASFENSDPVNFGKIEIASNISGARVFIDSVFWGKTPLLVDRVPVGQRIISVSADNHITKEKAVNLNLGEHQQHYFSLEKNFASLVIEGVPPGARVFIDGILQSRKSVRLSPGAHLLRIEAEHYFSYQDQLEVKEGEIRKIPVSLSPKPVDVSFLSKGEKLRIYVNRKEIGATPLSRELSPGHYSVDFISDSAGLVHSEALNVVPGKKISVAVPQRKTASIVPKLSDVMVYKDKSLSPARGYSNRAAVPHIYSRDSQLIVLELARPNEGFISVDGKLAGKKVILIDRVSGEVSVKVEAPGYYSDTIQIFGISADNSAERKKVSCSKNPDQKAGSWISKMLTGNSDRNYVTYSFSADRTQYTYCWNFPEYDPYRHFQYPIGSDASVDTLNRKEFKVYLFEKLKGESREFSFDGPRYLICCKNALATIIVQAGTRFYISERTIDSWLSKTFPTVPFEKYKWNGRSYYVGHVPVGDKIPAFVHVVGMRALEFRLPENEPGYDSRSLFNLPRFTISNRVIVIKDYAEDWDFLPKQIQDQKDKESTQIFYLAIKPLDWQTSERRRRTAIEDKARYGE